MSEIEYICFYLVEVACYVLKYTRFVNPPWSVASLAAITLAMNTGSSVSRNASKRVTGLNNKTREQESKKIQDQLYAESPTLKSHSHPHSVKQSHTKPHPLQHSSEQTLLPIPPNSPHHRQS